jgi:cellulose biosynthesis protein BcsQ
MTSCALVGAAGGAGTTRLTLEFAASLARAGRDVAVLDAAYATQGLADVVPGRIDPDVTHLVLGDDPLEAGLYDLDAGAGRLAVCPARAPFARLARAKSVDAARAFERRVEEATARFDVVLVDTPPVASNQAVAAVTATDRVAIVAPDDRRDAVPRQRDRLADLDVLDPAVVANRTTDPPDDATATVPRSDVVDLVAAPVSARGTGPFRTAVALAAETVLGVDLDLDHEPESFLDRLAGLGE